MDIDLELYRYDIRVRVKPELRLSAIDIAPEQPQHTLLFVHGFGGQALQWTYQLREFAYQERVIAVDLRGHGRSDKPHSGFGMPAIMADLESLLDALGINQKVVLVGHSFGGAIASEFTWLHPERVERLVLIATPAVYRLNRLYRLLLSLPNPVLKAAAPFTKGWLGAPPSILKAWYDENLCCWNGGSVCPGIRVPTLVIHGHQDRVFEKPAFEEVIRMIPGAEELDVGASGHMVMLERREAVHRAISRFLEAGYHSWRESEAPAQDTKRSSLLKERPWLTHYDEGVPYTIALPRVPLHYLLHSSVRRFPLRVAIRYEGSRLTYLRLGREANRFANALLALGLKPGDRVMLLLPNTPQMAIAFYGVLKAGGVAVFTLPTTNQEELLRQMLDCKARFLVVLTQFDELIYQIKNRLEPTETSPLEHIIFTHIGDYLPTFKRLALKLSFHKRLEHLLNIPMDASMHQFLPLLYANKHAEPELPISPNDLAAIIYTGGTTDAPKGVMLSHRNLVANALQTRHWMPDAREGEERFLCVLPFSHSYGLTTTLNVPVSLGATLIIKPRFEVADALNTVQHHHPTIFPGVPQMYMAINDFPGVRKYGLSSIRACISGSAPLPVEVQEAFEKLTRGRLVEGYGLTEASPVTHGTPLNGLRKAGSMGIPFPSTEARLVDLKRSHVGVPQGQIGELAVRGPQVMLGYWDKPDETRKVLTRDGWLLTGDIAQVDSDGYFRIISRKADMWYPAKLTKPAFPRDVEEVIFEVPQVKEVAVVAIAGQPIAFVIAKRERPSAEAVIAYCQRRLPPELVPRMVLFVDDFPRSFIGKVLRRELATRVEASQASQATAQQAPM